ncbi:MAG: AAA family ATPase [Spirulinaceae cyanobacterium]
MKVKSLKINSFRGISDLTLEFNTDKPTVIIGINGVGKSSILDCLAILLSWFVKQIQFDPESRTTIIRNGDFVRESKLANGKPIKLEDIERKKNKAQINITTLLNSQEVDWIVSIDKKKSPPVVSVYLDELEKITKEIRNQLETHPELNLPLTIYYPVNRAVFNTPLEIPDNSFQQIDAYEKALDGVQIGFDSFFRWFRAIEDLENEERRDNPDYRDKQLEAVRKAISGLIPEFSNLRVRRSPLRMTVNKAGQEITINQLSDGEKCLLAMIGDLARRLAIANPSLPDPLQGIGVVLIDEIELHLHPLWQRKIVSTLTQTFPNCQFIFTTHSPQVVSNIQPENIYILESTSEGIVAKRPESSFGRDSNRILEDLMKVPARPQEIKDSLSELFKVIAQGNLDEARQLSQELAIKIGSSEPELVKAKASIKRKEILGK